MPRSSLLRSLKKRSDFLGVAAARKRWVTPAFILQIAPVEKTEGDVVRDDSFICSYGLTASKKMIGCAVRRNRARRRLRALARDVLPALSLSGMRLVLIAKEDILVRDFALLRKDLLWALRKLGALSA